MLAVEFRFVHLLLSRIRRLGQDSWVVVLSPEKAASAVEIKVTDQITDMLPIAPDFEWRYDRDYCRSARMCNDEQVTNLFWRCRKNIARLFSATQLSKVTSTLSSIQAQNLDGFSVNESHKGGIERGGCGQG